MRRFLPLAMMFAIASSPGLAGEGPAVLTEPNEPGDPLHVEGTVYAPDGKTPAPGVTVYVYHTDAEGVYSETNDNRNPRIKATLITDPRGRYEFRTIRPAPYPGGGVPAHIHYVLKGGGYAEQRRDLYFEGDPALSGGMIDRSKAAGKFGSVRPVARGEDGVLHCTFDLRFDE